MHQVFATFLLVYGELYIIFFMEDNDFIKENIVGRQESWKKRAKHYARVTLSAVLFGALSAGIFAFLEPKFAGHFKGYLLSVLLPILFGILNCIFITIVLGAGFTVKAEGGVLEAVAAFSLYSMTTYTAAFILIGEELGWRAFLYDKIEKLIGLHGSIIIGGIIWGLWHIPPLITIGLNFGKNALGFPITNIFLMCIFCIFGGAMLQMLRKMTDSVIAPIIAHAVIDTICNPIATMFLSPKLAEGKNFQMGICMIISSVIIGLPCWIYMARQSKDNSKG